MGALFNGIQEILAGVLAFFFDLVPSFGLAIIFLVILVNILLFPLTLRQTRATRAFQEIQPEIRRIQKELKDEPEAMQKELVRVQRESGASAGGCLLPILVQMPIWFALFRVLNNISAVAREALDGVPAGQDPTVPVLPDSALLDAVIAHDINFLGMDLSLNMSAGIRSGVVAAIPYVVMLVLMVASQYFQQWHAQRGNSPRTDLTAQQKQQQQTQQVITRVMPLFIGFISWNFPAGLVVYWATSNIFRLGQQFVIFAIDGRPTPPSMSADKKDDRSGEQGDGDHERKRPQPRSAKNTRRRRK
jgi:YidC/Oxa1 family membrane protein insertase